MFNLYERESSRESQESDLSALPAGARPSHGLLSSSPSEDSLFKRPPAPVASSVSSSEQVYSGRQVDPATASKLAAFSLRLRTLTATALLTPARTPVKGGPRPGAMVTPRNRTPGSVATPLSCATTPLDSVTNRPDPTCFVAVIEGRGSARGEVGLAAVSLSAPALVLCQFSDCSTYPRTLAKLLAINPGEVIFPSGNLDPGPAASTGVKLYDDIRSSHPHAKVVAVHRKYFNEAKGLLAVKQVMVAEVSSVEMQFHNKFYCLAAACALLKYVEYTNNYGFNRASLKVEFQVADQSTVIDPATAEHIELLSSLGPRRSKLSLLGVLDHCSTPGGTRLLRANLFQPPVDRAVIEARQEAVTELIESPNLYDDLRAMLARFPHLDSILSLCIKKPDLHISQGQVDAKVDQMVGLRQVFELLPALCTALQQAQQSALLRRHSAALSRHLGTSALLLEMLNLVISDGAHINRGAIKFSRAMAVRQEVNGLLDISRKAFSECVNQLEQYVAELEEELALPLRLHWAHQQGFVIQLTSTRTNKYSVKDLPESSQRIQKKGRVITFVTMESVVKDQQVKDTMREIATMSNCVLDELLVEVREHIGFLYQLSETLSGTDLVLALAAVSMAPNFVRPEFGDSMVVRLGRHPILDTMPLEVVPNHIQADPLSRLHILSGPNMSGKSTYLRQVRGLRTR
jgi:DNA mismatch repair protein MSH4